MMAGSPCSCSCSCSRETGEGRGMPPESLSSFEQMLTSFVYSPVGTATSAVGGDDSVAGGSRKKQIRTKVDATPKGKKRSPAPPQTPPRPWRRRAAPSSLPHPDGATPGGGARAAAESAAMTSRDTVAADPTLAATSATVEDENPDLVVSLAGPGTPLVLPPDKNRGGSSSSHFRRRTNVDGSPATFSRFFLRHHPSAHTGGEEKAGEARGECEQIEHMEEAGKEGKDYSSPDGENKGNRIEATNKRKKRRKRFREGASRPLDNNTVGGDGQRKSKKKKKKKKKLVVVSPYFVAASSDRRVPEREAGVEDEVEVVVQRRTKKKRTSQTAESAAEPQTSSVRQQGRPKAAYGKKKKEKRKIKQQSAQLSAAERMADAYKRVPDDNPWIPPFSDHQLLQEFHFFDHWRVLVICMLLNRTTGREVQKVLPRLFLLCPDAATTTKVSEEDIEEIIKHLGLQKKRSKMIKRMSEEYLQPEWTHVTQLHGIGKYAADAYAIFCSGMWKEVKPNDRKLVDYWRFLLDDKDARESIMVQKSA